MATRSKLKNYNGLTDVEQRFCDAYMKNGGDGVAAMEEAGYSHKSAKRMWADMYKKPAVQNYLQTVTKSIERETIATTAEIREFLTSVMRNEAEMTEYMNRFIGGGEQEITPVVRKPNNREKLDAADKLLKISGAYNKDVNTNIIPIVIQNDLGK